MYEQLCSRQELSKPCPRAQIIWDRHIPARRMHVRSVSIYTAYALNHTECLRPPKSLHVLQTPEGLAETWGGKAMLKWTARLDDLRHGSSGGILMDETNIDIYTRGPQAAEWCGHRVDYCVFNLTATVRAGFQALQMSQMHKSGKRCHRGAAYFPCPGKSRAGLTISITSF